MNEKCSIVRDLIPLVLDGAASADSEQMVNTHVAQCPECAKVLHLMKDPNTVLNVSEESEDFTKAATRLRKKRIMRMLGILLAGLLIGVLLISSVLYIWQKLVWTIDTPLPNANYNIFLAQLTDGSVSMNIDPMGNTAQATLDFDTVTESGKTVLYICYKRAAVSLRKVENNIFSFYHASPDEMSTYDEIRQGTPKDYKVIWQTGWQIPAASPEMNRYYTILHEMSYYEMLEIDDGKEAFYDREAAAHYAALTYDLSMIDGTVPEWQ